MTTLEVLSPFNGRKVGEVSIHIRKQVEESLERASAVFADRSKWLTIPQRVEILEKFGKLLEENQERLIQQAVAEGGKPLLDTKAELLRAIDGVQVAIRTTPQLLGREIPMNLNEASMGRPSS